MKLNFCNIRIDNDTLLINDFKLSMDEVYVLRALLDNVSKNKSNIEFMYYDLQFKFFYSNEYTEVLISRGPAQIQLRLKTVPDIEILKYILNKLFDSIYFIIKGYTIGLEDHTKNDAPFDISQPIETKEDMYNHETHTENTVLTETYNLLLEYFKDKKQETLEKITSKINELTGESIPTSIVKEYIETMLTAFEKGEEFTLEESTSRLQKYKDTIDSIYTLSDNKKLTLVALSIINKVLIYIETDISSILNSAS